jgi:hypothetical protein
MARLLEKEQVLSRLGQSNPGPAETGGCREQLLYWYFTACLATGVPGNLEDYYLAAGFADEDSFVRAIAREHCYQQWQAGRDGTS